MEEAATSISLSGKINSNFTQPDRDFDVVKRYANSGQRKVLVICFVFFLSLSLYFMLPKITPIVFCFRDVYKVERNSKEGCLFLTR